MAAKWIPAFADEANVGILRRMWGAPPPTAPDRAKRSRGIMVFLVIIVLLIVVALAAYGGYAIGLRGRAAYVTTEEPNRPAPALAAPAAPPWPAVVTTVSADESTEIERDGVEKARIIRSRDAEAALLRRNLADRDARPEGDVALRRDGEPRSSPTRGRRARAIESSSSTSRTMRRRQSCPALGSPTT